MRRSKNWVGKVLRLEDGHQQQACVATLEEAIMQVSLDPTVPVAIHAHTVQGKGNKKAELSSTGAHGFPLKKASEMEAFVSEIYDFGAVPPEFIAWGEEEVKWEADKEAKAKTASAGDSAPGAQLIKSQKAEKIQNGVAKALAKCRDKGLPVVCVSADLQGSTGTAEFHKAYPDSSVDVGVAEANMISTAIGLSVAGYIPIVDTFAQFGVTKGALPLTMASLSEAPVIALFSHIGFQDAADGASHQAISFFAAVSSIPSVKVYSLSTSSEAEALLTEAIEKFAADRKSGKVPPTRIFFLGRENFPARLIPEGESYSLGRDQVVMDSSKEFAKSVTIVAAGSLVTEALKASDILREKSVGSVVIHSSAVNDPDLSTIGAALARTEGRIVTVEEHRFIGGIGAMLTHALVEKGVQIKSKTLAVGNHFGQSSYSALELYKKNGLDSKSIAAAAQALL